MQVELRQKAFLLKIIDFRDHDLIAHFLVESDGLRKAMIRGGKKTGKPSFFSAQPGDLLHLAFKMDEKSEWMKLLNQDTASSIRREKLSYFDHLFLGYWLELMMKLHISETNAADFFELLLSSHKYLLQPENHFDLKRSLYYIQKTIEFTGLTIAWQKCSKCGLTSSRIAESSEERAFRKMSWHFNPETGEINCAECSRRFPANLNAQHLKTLFYLQSATTPENLPPSFPTVIMKDLFFNFNQFLSRQFSIQLKSFPLLSSYFRDLTDI